MASAGARANIRGMGAGSINMAAIQKNQKSVGDFL